MLWLFQHVGKVRSASFTFKCSLHGCHPASWITVSLNQYQWNQYFFQIVLRNVLEAFLIQAKMFKSDLNVDVIQSSLSLYLSLTPPSLTALFFPLSIREAVSALWCDYRSSRQNSPEACHGRPPPVPQRTGSLWKLLYIPLFNWLATTLIITDTGPGFKKASLRWDYLVCNSYPQAY